jgi:dipeptidyl aminopeptidase/acylaminoacyl peptidase
VKFPDNSGRSESRRRRRSPAPKLFLSRNDIMKNRAFPALCLAATLLLSPLFSMPTRAQVAVAKKPITHEAVWLMKRVGAPTPSPDGKYVAFSVAEPSYDDKEQSSDLWMVATDGGGKPRRLTFSKLPESDPAWSPDGRELAFVARREGDEARQVYVINLADGGEARRVTSLSTGARAPRWRPDGKALLFASDVFPGAMDDDANKKIAAERKAQKYKVRAYDGYPIRNWDHWLDDMQAHLFIQSFDPPGPAKDILAGTKLVSEPGFAGAGTNGSDDLQAVWTPDGQAVVFTATTERGKAAYAEYATHLFQAPASGGEPKRLTAGAANFSRPTFSPDGKSLFCAHSPINGKVYNLDRIARLDWPNVGEPKILTANFDRSVTSFDLTPDGKTLYLLAEEHGHEKLFSLPAQGGDVRLAFEMTTGVYANLAIAKRAASPLLFANWESAVSPAEIVRIDLAAKRNAPLSAFNAEAVAKIDWLPVRHFWFKGKAAQDVHNLIVLPPNFDERKKYPLFTFIHGGPHAMFRDQFFLRWNYHLLAQPGYVVLLTNYTGSTGFGEKFAQDIQGDPFGRCGSEITEAVDAAAREFPFIDGERVAAGGASYGGHLANWLQATTTRYKCLISHAGLINSESQWGTSDTSYFREVTNGGPVWEQGETWRKQNPIRYAANFKTPILLTVGENDFRVPLNQTLENWTVLQRLRIPSRLLVFPEENHWILKGEDNRYLFQEVHAWLAKHLKP